MKLFGMYGVILITQVSCHSANYHQPKGIIEDLIPSEYQKNPFTQQNVEITKKVYGFKNKFSSVLVFMGLILKRNMSMKYV